MIISCTPTPPPPGFPNPGAATECSLRSPLQILTKDSVTIAVDAVVYFRINNPTISVTNVSNVSSSTQLLAQTILRNVLGTKNLSEILSDRESISHSMQVRAVA